ncbi:class A beta-lactamase [Mycobacterium asiaticum]|uniref:Beta-lactamase n=1 Tax=Mycobacterium asiaticum TaxID=1790 RepID=A0A1A3N0K7_MYCAS|nr:class A beta-lactamase [Mycobacterium asiaticum]OBK15316.1 class A beta-lactamase [Mycobacterium asiaticum]
MGISTSIWTRRQAFSVAAGVLVSGCARPGAGRPTTPTTTKASPDLSRRFGDLERRYGGRVGVYVPETATTTALAYRADERFAFCSTFKAPLVAAVLHQYPLAHLDTLVTYTRSDINSTSPVTEQHVGSGMTVRQLCDAAIRHSDGTAANLLLSQIGGPAGFTGYLRGLGDGVSRLDQAEPELNRDAPTDDRDTTTPRAMASVFQQLVLGDALPADKRTLLVDWMMRNTTGDNRIRAAFPDWKVADKTGSGDYGRTNDVAVAWSPGGVPHVIAIYSDCTAGGYDAQPDEAVVADAARIVVSAIGT